MSVFTYDPTPPRVSSPWLQPPSDGGKAPAEHVRTIGDAGNSINVLDSNCDNIRLVPEPQEGPVEYKLHLLLRPRRAYRYTGSQTKNNVDPKYFQKARVVGASTADQTRQDRCQHLTTQLLWRLRQSSPYHASVARQDIDLPLLPEDSALVAMSFDIARLAPGLEESQGAFYEVGVSDEGTLVGITRDEMDQSIATLRWMAANLGCVVEITRGILVGECELSDETLPSDGESCTAPTPAAKITPKKETLFVAEAFVRPHVQTKSPLSPKGTNQAETISFRSLSPMSTSKLNEQLRMTLTGPTGSGKSTLLGALSTGAFDDGHGKGRLNSLKHRHEMASGMTSTVTQELVGYSGDSIINYTNPNIESWFGIHDFAKNGRLVFISDSAGHPRFRRTTLRGLVGWAPHWTFLCLSAAPETPGNPGGAAGSAHDGHGSAAALSKDHLDLCLKLGLPLVIVLTKSDLMNKESLKRVLSPIWTAVKGAGRAPCLIQSKVKFPEWARSVCDADVDTIRRALSSVRDSGDFCATVPVILQSSVTGYGTGLIHALLRELPVPPKPLAHDYLGRVVNQEQPETLFHIEDRYNRPASYATSGLAWQANVECVVSGYLRFGRLELGQTVTVGPFPIDEDVAEAAQLDDKTASPSRSSLPSSHASPRVPFSDVARSAIKNAIPATCLQGEWRQVRIVSIRNLRMSVQTLEADQVGTLGLALAGSAYATSEDSALRPLKPRRGMVVAVPNKHMIDNSLELQAAAVITAYFSDTAIGRLGAGTPVTFYIASVRAQARVAKIWSSPPVRSIVGLDGGKAGPAGHMEDDMFGLEPISDPANHSAEQGYCARLELLFGREWVELGSKIVILEGASREGAVLDGFVGTVVKVSET